MDEPEKVPDGAIVALIDLLVRKGMLEPDDIIEAAAKADNGTERGAAIAYLLQIAMLQAAAPSQSDWEAERARKRFTVVRNDDPPVT